MTILSRCVDDSAPLHTVSVLFNILEKWHTVVKQVNDPLRRANSNTDPALLHQLSSFFKLDMLSEQLGYQCFLGLELSQSSGQVCSS